MWEFRSWYPSIVSAAARALRIRSVSNPPTKGTSQGPGTLLLEAISAEQLVLEQSSYLLLFDPLAQRSWIQSRDGCFS